MQPTKFRLSIMNEELRKDLNNFFKYSIDTDTPLFIIGELHCHIGIMTFKNIIDLHKKYTDAKLNLLKTSPEDFVECLAYIRSVSYPCDNLFMYASLPFCLSNNFLVISEFGILFCILGGAYIFIPHDITRTRHMTSINQSIMSFINKYCLPLPIWKGNDKEFESSLSLSKFKITEFINKVYTKLSPSIIKISKENGYMFGVEESDLWFVKPQTMHPNKISKIENLVNEKFKDLARTLLPTSNKIIANLPLNIIGILRGLQYDSNIIEWFNELLTNAQQRRYKGNILIIKRYIYINAFRPKEGYRFKNIHALRKLILTNENNEEIIFNYSDNLMGILQKYFTVREEEWPDNYKVNIVLTGLPFDNSHSFFNWGNSIDPKFSRISRIEELISNWILFQCDRMRLLQYEVEIRDQHYVKPYYLFYYHDSDNDGTVSIESEPSNVECFYIFERFLETAETVYQDNPNGDWHVLPLSDFLNFIDNGKVSFIDVRHSVSNDKFAEIRALIEELSRKSHNV